MAIQTIVVAERHSGYLERNVVDASAQSLCIVAVAALVAAGIGRRASPSRRGRRPSSRRPQTGKPPLGAEPADAGGRRDPRGVPATGRTAASRRWSGSAASTRTTRRAALPRASRSSGPGYPATPRPCCERRRRSGATRHGRCRPTTSSIPSTRSATRSFRPIDAEPAARAGLALQAQGRQHSALSALRAGGAADRRDDDEAQVAAAVARFDKDNLNAVVLAARAAHAQVPAAARRCATTSGCCSPGPDSAIPRSRSSEKAVALGPNTELGRGRRASS